MSFETPSWSAPREVRAVSTTRNIAGLGSSAGVYSSLNVGLHVGDNQLNVQSNRAALRDNLSLPNEPVWLDQVHEANVVDAVDTPLDTVPTADASFADKAGVVCAVMTADCLPLLLTNTQGTEVAAVHGGWRGMAAGVIENAVAKFSCDPSDILAWAGPCIGPKHFEVGLEVREQLGGPSEAYTSLGAGKLLANLYLLAGQRLLEAGVSHYTCSSACTYSDAEQFFSYRRDGQCGRMVSLIWIQDKA